MIYGPYPAAVVSIHDGDTMRLLLDLGFGISLSSLSCRLWGINAPELGTDAGAAARDYLRSLVPLGDRVAVVSHGWDKYGGRFDGVVVHDGVDLSVAMLDSGHAVPLV